MAILEVQGLEKVYTTRLGSNSVKALSNVTFSVEQGEYVAIMGESGSGKTTLLNILAALDRPTKGEVRLEGKSLSTIREKEISAFRRDNLGFVFQDFNLLDTFTLKDNIFLRWFYLACGIRKWNNGCNPLRSCLAYRNYWKSIRMKYPADKSSGQLLQEPSLPIPN